MRQPMILLALSALGACSSPLPTADPHQAWVDMITNSGNLIMAERLDGQRLADGRYFQMRPGRHELIVRFDFEVHGTHFEGEIQERTCYLTVRYDHFMAGQHYRLRARAIAMQPSATLYDDEHRVVAENSDVDCVP